MPIYLQMKLKMQGEHDLYEYAVVRLVPRVERQEFFNVGLVMLCKRKRWLKMDFYLNPKLFLAFEVEMKKEFVQANLTAFKEIAEGICKTSPIAQLPPPERFRWLTAVRSSSLQTSRPHVGKTTDLEKTFCSLFEELVGRNRKTTD